MFRLPAARAFSSSSLLTSTLRRQAARPPCLHQAARSIATAGGQQQQIRHQHAVSNPTLANIEKRWEQMPPQEQAELWMALRDRMTVDWKQLTTQEKKASYWIAFGPHGPRSMPDPSEKWQILKLTTYAMIATTVIFVLIRLGARGTPKTMSEEWQTAQNEYLRGQNAEPITGLSSEGYTGKGMIQSPPRGVDPSAEEE